MYIEVLLLFLLGHTLGDFYLQTGRMAVNKGKSLKWVLLHCIIYAIGMSVAALCASTGRIWLYALIAIILHFIIDMVKFAFVRGYTKTKKMTRILDRNIFFIDQLLHIVTLVMIAYLFIGGGASIKYTAFKGFFDTIGVNTAVVIAWVLAILLIHKPANIAISKLLMPYKPSETKEIEQKDNKAGRFVGTIERIIMLIFLSIGQYSAIGLVLTAKSIARYDRISKEPEFAEYYLLGTLLSTLTAIIVSVIL